MNRVALGVYIVNKEIRIYALVMALTLSWRNAGPNRFNVYMFPARARVTLTS